MKMRPYEWCVAVLAVAAMLACPALAKQAGTQTAPAPKTPPTQAPASKCGPGQVEVNRDSPFGMITTCQPGTAPAPSSTTPPATPPASEAQQPATKPSAATPATPSQGATPSGQQQEKENKTTTPPVEEKPAAPTPTAAGQPSAPSTIDSSNSPVMLNLENADLYQVLRILGPELKINTIIDPAVRGTVTINTSTTVKQKDLFALLEMLLEINGATAVKQTNGYYAIVPLGSAKQQAVELHYAKKSELPLGPGDAYTLEAVPLKFVSGAEMTKILTPFMSPGGQIVVQDKGNLLFISDTAAKLAEIKQIIDMFDDPVLGRQRVRMVKVTNNLAVNLIPELKSVFSGYGMSTSGTAIQFLPVERLNSILVMSPSAEVFDEVETWVKKLDQPSEEVGLRTYVYPVQNSKASELADLLDTLYGIGGLGSTKPPTTSAGPAISQSAMSGTVTPENPGAVMGLTGAAPQAPARPNAAAPQGGGAPQATLGMQANVRFMADDRNNSLIIQATPHDYEQILRTLHDVDLLPRQVLIDAHIYEVDLTGDLSVGLQAFLDKKANLQTINTSGSFAGATPSLVMQTFAILHNTYALQLFLNANENRTRVKTLSAPSILVTNNTAARIQVGSEVPVPIGSALTPVQSGGSSIFAQTIQFRDTGVILNVTPRINAGGVVMLNIGQEVSSAQPNGTSAIVAPVISKSDFQTTVMLKDGQTLALGGIITTSNSLTKNRIPLLGDIPGIGLLFGNTGWNTSRKELVLMITPHVAEDLNQATSASNDLVNSLKSLKKNFPNLPQSK